MKVTYNWLKDFVDIKISPQALAEKLTMSGLEVTSLEKKDGDFIFEIEVTSNRPDLLSVAGIAREAAAITNKKFKLPQSVYSPESIVHSKKTYRPSTINHQPLFIEIEDKKDCPLYTAKIIENVKVAASPDWLKKRLELMGCRSVNNVVDITNYVLFEYGQPLHAFDLDKLALACSVDSEVRLNMVIRRAEKGEQIITIDGVNRTLNEEVLIIASGVNNQPGRPVALAGIMGGSDSEVTIETQNILLEAAVFNPIIVRRVRQATGIQSESSYRFERGLDPCAVEGASLIAARLIEQICSGKCVLAKKTGLVKKQAKRINLDVSFVHKTLGAAIKAPKIKSILDNLGFTARLAKNSRLSVKVPSYRADINLPVDLIEEAARIFGYGRIPKTLPKVMPQVSTAQSRQLVCLARNILSGLGFNEAITYSLIDRACLDISTAGEQPCAVEILNPLSKEQQVLRSGLSSGLLRCLANNLNQRQDYVNLFEIGKVFSAAQQGPKEELALGIVLCGERPWLLESGLIKEQASLLHLKGALEALFTALGIRNYNFKVKDNHSAVNITLNRQDIGILCKLPVGALEKFAIKNKDIFFAQVSLEKLFACANLNKKFQPLPVYPGIFRDISIILKEGVVLEEVLTAMKEKGGDLLAEVKIADCYKGKQIPAGFRGITVSCFYRCDERTLTEEEVNPLHSKIAFALADRFGAQIRKA